MSTVTTDIMTRLREATREQHSQIERNMSALSGDIDMDAYGRLLAGFYGYYIPLEDRILALADQWPWLRTDYPERRRTPWLTQDLRYLGINPDTVPRCDDVTPVRNIPEALGCLYVVEGSSLGGQHISRYLHEKRGLTPETGSLFYTGYGDETGTRWQTFRGMLAEYPFATVEDADRVIGSACTTFTTLDTWLGKTA